MPTKREASILEALRDDDLARSGIGRRDLRRLGGMRVFNEQETEDLTGIEDAVCYEIPYHHVDGGAVKFARYRMFSAGDRELGLRYWQEPNTIPRLYLPPVVDWTKLAQDPRAPLVLTEGEKKAVCASVRGIPCIAVGGVWMYKAARWGLQMLKDFDWFTWAQRRVDICYDNDVADNEDVRKAMEGIAAALRDRGARVFVRRLPGGAEKIGLDDYLVSAGKQAAKKFQALDCEEEWGSRELHGLNDRVLYVEQSKAYYGIQERVLYKSRDELAKRYGSERVLGPTGKPMRAVDAWVDWEHRRMASALTYEPGKPETVGGAWNTWRPSETAPKRGDCGMWLEVLRSIENWKWLLQWLAYPLQHPGTKLFTAALVWSREQGTGKSFIGEMMMKIYGEQNTATVSSQQLAEKFNSWCVNKQFIVGEEVSDYAQKADTHVLKGLITRPTIQARYMGVDPFEVPNKANFYFTSNEPAPLKIEDADRRFFVGNLSVVRPDKFWKELDRWAWTGGGAAAFYWYLLHEVDLSDFNPKAAAPMTNEKRLVQYTGMSDVEQWCHDLVQQPDSMMPSELKKTSRGKQDVFTVSMLMHWYEAAGLREVPVSVLGKALVKAGAVRPVGAIECRDGVRRRMVAIRNMAEWASAKPQAWAENWALGGAHEIVATDADSRVGDRDKVVPINKGKRR